MRANIFAALVALPAIILEETVEFFGRIFADEEQILEGKNVYDEES